MILAEFQKYVENNFGLIQVGLCDNFRKSCVLYYSPSITVQWQKSESTTYTKSQRAILVDDSVQLRHMPYSRRPENTLCCNIYHSNFIYRKYHYQYDDKPIKPLLLNGASDEKSKT